MREVHMSAYVIAEVEVTDPQAYEEYRRLVPATVEKYGGRFLVRGGAIETLEGGWQPKRLVVLEFEGAEQARRWYESPEYGVAMPLRHKAANSRVVIVEGAA
jgi:uncharacterized protein (DUF1330 family)